MKIWGKIFIGGIYGTLLVGLMFLWFGLYKGLARKQKVEAVEKTADVSEKSYRAETSEIVRDFAIEIPSIGVKRKVISNVDPANKDEYLGVLENYVAHGKYTLLPDEAVLNGNVYLFAHREGVVNGKDVGFFKRLDELSKGDDLIVYYKGNVYLYSFRDSKVIEPWQTEVYTSYSATPTLTLQTCEDGQSKRLILFFDLVSY